MFSLSVTLRSSTRSATSALASSSPLAATRSARSWTRSVNCSDLATKSVSHLISAMAMTSESPPTATAPWSLARSERLAELDRPFSRSHLAAASKSPSFSSRARLASIIPAPVCLRSAWTSLAVNSATISLPRWSRWLRSRPRRPEPPQQQPRRRRLGRGLSGTAPRAQRPRRARPQPAQPQRPRPERPRARLGRAASSGLGPQPRRRGLGRLAGVGGLLGGSQAGVALGGLGGGLVAGLGLLAGDLGLLLGGAHGGGRGATVARHLLGADEATLLHGVGHDPAHQGTGADGVVVAGDHVVHDVGVTVGVDHGDQRDAELVGLGHRDVLLLRVEHEDGVGLAIEVPDAVQVPQELVQLPGVHQGFLLGHGVELAGVALALQLGHLGDPLGDGLEVGEHAAQPALVDVGHVAGQGVGLDGVGGLLLGPDEEQVPALGGHVPDELVRDPHPVERLLEIDDVDPLALPVQEALHLGVPAPGLVSEVDTCVQQLLHGDDRRHLVHSSPTVSRNPCACAVRRPREWHGRKWCRPWGQDRRASVPATLPAPPPVNHAHHDAF